MGKKQRSLGYQFENAIDRAFGKDGKGGANKHAMRKSGKDTTGTVFSFKERSSLKQTGYDLGKHINKYYPDVKNVNDVTPEMVQSYLNHKANTNNNNSLIKVKSCLNKLDKVSSKAYKSKESSFMDGVKKPKTDCPNNIRKNVNCTNDDWSKIKEKMEGSHSKANPLLKLAKPHGLRAESLSNMRVKDFDFKNKLIHIVDDKGRRDRTISMRDEEACRSVCGVLGPNDRITNLKPDSINRQFGRLAQKADITKFKDAKTGLHAMRKGEACNYARELKEQGRSREDILSEVSRWLGHGTTRRDVLKKYLDPETIEYISK